MTIVLKGARFIFIKIPAAIVLAVLFVFRFLFQYLSGVVALLFRIAGGIAILISAFVLVFGLATYNEMIWSAIGGAILILLPFFRTFILVPVEFMIEGLKTILFLR